MSESDLKTLGRIEQKIDQVLALANKHDAQLNGNGKPGLKQDVAELQSYVATRRKLEWVVISGAIGLGLTGLASAAIFIIRIMPAKGT